MTKETGGFAFPRVVGDSTISQGMTLRDYFAAKAMQGLISTANWDTQSDFYSKWAYEMADAMLKARK